MSEQAEAADSKSSWNAKEASGASKAQTKKNNMSGQLPGTLDRKEFPHPYRPLIFMIFSVLVVECFIEIFLVKHFPLTVFEHILADSGFMIIVLLPFFYRFLYLPYKRHHEYHNESQAQIEYLSRQLINSTENERKMLAQNLHDGFGQVLTAMQFGVETIKSTCHVDGETSDMCTSHTEKLSELISDLGDYVRNISTGLHPHMLDELGLQETLKWHFDEFSRQYGDVTVNTHFSQMDEPLPAEIQLALFRVCQEALNNIAKHANATQVDISLDRKDETLILSIEDDGEGFDLSELKSMGAKRSGIGLLGMRERVAALGGKLYLDSAPDKGTSIHVKLPTTLRRRKHEAYQGFDS